jgi:excisionase family DNA binding protein
MYDQGDVITYDAAAELLHVSRPTLDRLVKARRLERLRQLGDKRTYLRRSEVEALRGWQSKDELAGKARAGHGPALAGSHP